MSSVTVSVGDPLARGLPPIGLGMAADGPLDPRERGLLRSLAPAHLRQNLDLDDERWIHDLERARQEAVGLGCALELAIHSKERPDDAAPLAEALGDGPPLNSVLVLARALRCPDHTWVDRVRALVGSAGERVRFASGSNANFTEVNRDWAPVRGAAAVVYPVTPQVHAFDDRSLIETLPMQALTVRTARERAPGSAVVVSPITLRQRFNPLGATPDPGPGQLPPSVDVRQMSLLAGAWTLGSVASLTAGGADSLTYFETAGWRGVVERSGGCPLPERFPSRPGMVFPAYHVLADVREDPGATPLRVSTEDDDPPRVAALALRSGGGVRLLLANLLAEPQRVSVAGLPAGALRIRVLDEDSAVAAAFDPERFRAAGTARRAGPGPLDVELLPYACARLDAGEAR